MAPNPQVEMPTYNTIVKQLKNLDSGDASILLFHTVARHLAGRLVSAKEVAEAFLEGFAQLPQHLSGNETIMSQLGSKTTAWIHAIVGDEVLAAQATALWQEAMEREAALEAF